MDSFLPSGIHTVNFNSSVVFNCYPPNTVEVRPKADVNPGETTDFLHVPHAPEREYYRHIGKDDHYQITTHPKGRVLIINNEFKNSPDERTGSEKDVYNMLQLWKGIGCQVEIKPDLTAERIETAIQNFVDWKEDADFCVIIVMSHGAKDDMIIGNEHTATTVRNIVDIVAKSSALHGKPKLLFFQMCRGADVRTTHADAGGFDTSESTWVMSMLNNFLDHGKILGSTNTVVDETAEEYVSKNPDMLLAFGTQPDHKAFRDTTDGSWFIESVATVFSKKARTKHVEELMVEVKNKVKGYKVDAPGREIHECVATRKCRWKLHVRKEATVFLPGISQSTERIKNSTVFAS